MTITLKNPDAPMTFKQGILIRNLGGGDVRPENLTQQQASDRINELSKTRAKGDPVLPNKREDDFRILFINALHAGRRAVLDALIKHYALVLNPAEYEDCATGSAPIKNDWCMHGACGFAWVNIKPGTNPFAKWLVKSGLARKDSYYKGVTIWISDYNQSVDLKAIHAGAMAEVFQQAGYTAQAMDRLD